MTEFSASVPIGGVKVGVEYDLSGLDKGEAELKRRVAKGMRVMVPTPQGAFQAALGFQAAQGARVPTGGFWNPAWGTGPGGAAMTPGGAGGWVMSPGGGGGGGGGRGRPPRPPAPPKPGFFQQPVNFSMGGHGGLLTVFGIARTAEAIADFGSSSIQATRDLKAAVNNAMAIKAMVQSRQATETAFAQIPFAGHLGIAARGLIDSARGVSPADIERETAEAERTRELSQARSDAAAERKVSLAKTQYASDRIFMGGAGSMRSNLAMIEADRQLAAKRLSDQYQTRADMVQPNKSAEDYTHWYSNNTIASIQSRQAEAKRDNDALQAQRDRINSDKTADLAASNKSYSVQKWEAMLGGRNMGQDVNPFDVALGGRAVRTDMLTGQDESVVQLLERIAENTGTGGAPILR